MINVLRCKNWQANLKSPNHNYCCQNVHLIENERALLLSVYKISFAKIIFTPFKERRLIKPV